MRCKLEWAVRTGGANIWANTFSITVADRGLVRSAILFDVPVRFVTQIAMFSTAFIKCPSRCRPWAVDDSA